MLSRFFVSLNLAALGAIALTGSASAATIDIETRDDVMILTAVVALAAMFVLLVAYAIKSLLGLTAGPPPPPADDHAAHGAHH